MTERKLHSVKDEGLMVGAIFTDPSLFLDYSEELQPTEKYFYHEHTRFLFELAKNLYFVKKHENIDEVKINIYLEENPDQKEYYKEIDGYKTIKRLMSIADLKEVRHYYNNLVKFAVLRELEKSKFPVDVILKLEDSKFEKITPEQIIDAYEYKLNSIQMNIKGISDSIILGKDMLKVYEGWKEKPDWGEEIPFPILNNLIRGWRIGKLNMTGMHSGFGKSRFLSRIITYLGVEKQIPVLVMVNEQDKDEWDAMLLASIVNNVFAPKTGIYIDETKIVSGLCTGKEDEICKEASKYIQENSKIYFQELGKWDYNTIKRTLKKHRIKNVKFFLYDTFKPFRGKKLEGMANWEMFVETAGMLKEICGTKQKGGLDMGGWITFQLTDETLYEQILTSKAIANGKHIKHVADMLSMARPLTYKEKKEKYSCVLPDGNEVQLDPDNEYYILFLDKNRGGKDKIKLIYEVNKGQNRWKELGFAKYNAED